MFLLSLSPSLHVHRAAAPWTRRLLLFTITVPDADRSSNAAYLKRFRFQAADRFHSDNTDTEQLSIIKQSSTLQLNNDPEDGAERVVFYTLYLLFTTSVYDHRLLFCAMWV